MTSNRSGRHWLLWMVAGMLLAGFVLSTGPEIEAGKKDKEKVKAKDKDKDKSDSTETPKKEPKVEPPPSAFPKRVDLVDPTQGGSEHVTFIDDEITKGWKANKTYPSERCTDYEFIRRASLDIVGRIPTVEEINNFMKQTESKRRSWLINEMLDGKSYGNGAEYAQNFANIWSVNLMTRSGSGKHYQVQMNDWLYNHFKGSDRQAPDWSKIVYQLIAGEGETNRNGAVNYLLHNLGEEFKQDTGKNGKWDMVPATSRTTKLFLGIRTQCVQCHDHPFNGEWKQENFWGINAFFRQVQTNGRPLMVGKKKQKGEKGAQEYDVKENTSYNANKLVTYERRNAVLMVTDPTFLDGKKIPKDFKGTRREALAKFVTESPWFAKAHVNRTWGHFFGSSFLKGPVDDFHEQNPISHEELLNKLADDWAKNYQHNPKVLIRWICNSQAYGLSSRANKWNDKTDDETLFARMLLKPMSPEQMFESLMIATQAKLGQDKDDKLAAREKWFAKLIVNFGNDEGEEGTFSGTVVQALLLMNGQDINTAISDAKEGAVAEIIKKRGATYQGLPAAVNDMFMHVLSRPATQKEIADLKSDRFYMLRKTAPNTPQFWTNYYQDVMWALLNSNEFILNH